MFKSVGCGKNHHRNWILALSLSEQDISFQFISDITVGAQAFCLDEPMALVPICGAGQCATPLRFSPPWAASFVSSASTRLGPKRGPADGGRAPHVPETNQWSAYPVAVWAGGLQSIGSHVCRLVG